MEAIKLNQTSKPQIWVIKQNIQGEETWRYKGSILERSAESILIEAFFNRSDINFHGVLMRHQDRFLERYYQNRWYNIFEIHDRDDDQLKGWYCNVTQPAIFENAEIRYIDLALDLLVYPTGNYLVLDEDEFEQLAIDDETRHRARTSLNELIQLTQDDLLPGLI
jgi:uncharacterized protein